MEAESEKKSADGKIFHTPEKNRAVVYIDGFNLYNGIKKLGKPRLKWLDVGKLGADLADGECAVKFFTALVKGDSEKDTEEKRNRQNIYHEALAAACPSLEFIYGMVDTKSMWCKNCLRFNSEFGCCLCGAHNTNFQERRTDVNLAFHLTRDFVAGAFERAFVVSGDSDFTLPVSEIAATPGREMIVVSPPKRENQKLTQQANRHIAIKQDRLERCLLSVPVVGKRKKIYPPPEWKAANR